MNKQISCILIVCCILFSSTVPALAAINDTGFSDVAAGTWYAEAAVYCWDNGLMSGTTSTTFSPNLSTSRAMIATILYRQAGFPAVTGTTSFSDAVDGTWYSNAVAWAAGNDIISGYGNGLFGSDDPITREQLATIFWRSAGKSDIKEAPADFADENAISSYAVMAVDWAQENSIVTGKGNNFFDPKGEVTRAETAAMLYRYLNIETEDPSERSTDLSPETFSEPSSGTPSEPSLGTPNGSPADPQEAENSMLNLTITVRDRTFTVKLYDNASARAILEQMPFTLEMDDYATQEKVVRLPFALPSASTETPARINSGDIYLWSGNNLVLFYTTFSNSYSYVPVGYIEDVTGLRDALGSGRVAITFSA